MSSFDFFNPDSLGPPRGYSNGVLAPEGRMLFVAGQIGWDGLQQITSPRVSDQFAAALDNVLTVVAAAGAKPEHVVRLTIYVTDKLEYIEQRKEIGAAYRARFGKHYPAMALVQVAALLEDRAKVEIEATAVVPKESA